MHITDIAIRALNAPERGTKVYRDNTLRGFGIRVSQGGTKSFILQHGRDRQFITIGRYPIITLQEARTEAKRLLAEATLGKRRPKSIRWCDAVTDYLTDVTEKNRPRTLQGYRRQLNKHFDFGTRLAADVTYDDLSRRLDRLRDRPGERSHALQTVKIFLNWMKKPPRRYIPYNPLEGLTAPKVRSRRRKLSNADIAAIYRTALDGADAFSHIVALVVLMGQRRTETAMLRRSWMSTADRILTIPAAVSKNKCDHAFPYSAVVERILATIPDYGDLYFPAMREHVRGIPTTCFADWNKSKLAFVERCGVGGWTFHMIRKKMATTMAELHVAPHVIEVLLNHRLGTVSNKTGDLISDVADVYNLHHYLPEMRLAVEKWESHLQGLLTRDTVPAAA